MTPDDSFDVTHVDSMQWNRTLQTDVLTGDPGLATEPEPVSPEVVAEVRAAIRREVVDHSDG